MTEEKKPNLDDLFKDTISPKHTKIRILWARKITEIQEKVNDFTEDIDVVSISVQTIQDDDMNDTYYATIVYRE